MVNLHTQGMSYRKIIERILEDKGVLLRKSHLSDWVNNTHQPFGSAYDFVPEPTPELAYVIGVSRGDASLSIQKWSYRIRLRAIDREFVAEFDRCATVVLRCPRHSIGWIPKRGQWSVQVTSHLLYRFLKQALHRLRTVVSHCARCVAAFLKGFFDSEASVSGRSLTVSNSNLATLRLVKRLLNSLSISSTGPRLVQRGNRPVIIKGVAYHANKNIYLVYIRAGSLRAYAARVGFVITRKQRALASALQSDRLGLRVK